jgi:ATP-binding cassette subfamily B protein
MSSTQPTEKFGEELRRIRRHAVQVWRLVPHRHQWALAGAALVMAVTGLSNTAIPLLLGGLVDRVETDLRQGVGRQTLFLAAVWFLALIGVAYVFREVLNVFRRYLVENSCTRISRDLTVRVVGHILKMDLSSLRDQRVGTLHGRITRSVEGFVRFLRLSFLDFLPALFIGGFALVAAVCKQPLLGLVMMGVIPTAVFLTVRQLISQKGVRLTLLASCEEIDGAVVEQLGGIEHVRASNTHDREVKRLEETCERRRAKEIRHHFEMALYGCAKALNEGLFHIVVLGLAIYLAVTRPEAVSFGDVLSFSGLYLSVMAPLNEIHRVLDEGHESSLRVADLLKILNEPADRSFDTAQGPPPRLVEGAPLVVAQDLVVEYTTADGKLKRGLDHVSLAIRAGETVGVAGPSGGGKSTLVKVLLRLTHPTHGSMLVGGIPLEQVSREDISRLVGYVGQVPFVFSGTIAENIAYGKEDATREEIQRAAELAHLHNEIMLMPGGYEHLVAERGGNLSGGQRQRLALARILLRQPPVLILDEATSALDNISERLVQRSLGLTSADRTTILVAHRLSTLRDADRIVVFDEGRIVEAGTYQQLVQQGGVFTELVMSSQTSSAEPAPKPAAAAVHVA